MPSASYYREQARLLLEWAQTHADSNPELTIQLRTRATEYLARAAETMVTDQQATENRLRKAIEAFNEKRMAQPASVTQQQQQIQPKKEDE